MYAYEQVPPTFEVLLHNIHLHQLEALPTRGTSEYRIGWKKNKCSTIRHVRCVIHGRLRMTCLSSCPKNWENTLSLLKVAAAVSP